jgi:hypothetical protein
MEDILYVIVVGFLINIRIGDVIQSLNGQEEICILRAGEVGCCCGFNGSSLLEKYCWNVVRLKRSLLLVCSLASW